MSDPLLAPFLEAPDDETAGRRLAAVLEEHVLPLLRRIAARKLRGVGGADPAADVEDVVGDASLVLCDRLGALRAPGAVPIQSLADYAARVAFTACAHHVRRRHPERARLKSRLRYVLAHRPALALWAVDGLGSVCGLSAWRGRAPEGAAARALQELADAGEHVPEPAASAERLGRRVESLLGSVGGPVELEALVGALARLDRVEAPRPVPLDGLASPEPSREATIDGRRAVERTWREIVELPVRQRLAMLLSLRDAGGASLLWVFPLLGIASIRRIAEVLGWPPEELADVWSRLPLDDHAIAARLECDRQQVINLRQAARKRLARRVALGGETPARAGGANLVPIPSSLESDS
jgi:DNA-directed RNA polymerase specialized sigma24 family protein